MPTAPRPAPDVVDVHIGDLTIVAETAVSAEERGQGLSDRPSLAQNAGMLFFMGEARTPGFHMRNMQFPLDFVWISADGRVADLTENVLHPAVAGETLSGISPSAPVTYVLEVNAGVIEAAGIEIGDLVAFEPDILASSSSGRSGSYSPTSTSAPTDPISPPKRSSLSNTKNGAY